MAQPITAIDSHAHVFKHGLKLAPSIRYAPDYDAMPEDYIKILDANGISNAVLIQPSFLGTDNSYMLDASRRHVVCHDVDWLTSDRRDPGEPRFPGLKAIAMVEATVGRGEKTSVERRDFLSSLPLDARLFARAVRAHGGIENRLHWSSTSSSTTTSCACAPRTGRETRPPSSTWPRTSYALQPTRTASRPAEKPPPGTTTTSEPS